MGCEHKSDIIFSASYVSTRSDRNGGCGNVTGILDHVNFRESSLTRNVPLLLILILAQSVSEATTPSLIFRVYKELGWKWDEARVNISESRRNRMKPRLVFFSGRFRKTLLENMLSIFSFPLGYMADKYYI